MELAQLQIFREIADAGSVQAAALRLHRVPSNLTTRLKQLEEELGAELFIREKMRLRLSATGASFLDYTRRILDLADEAKLSVAGDEPRGVLPLGSLESTAAVRIPPVLAAFHQRYPEVALDLSTGPSGKLIDRVLEGELAAAFVDGPLSHPALTGVPVFNEELVLISAVNRAPIKRAQDVNGANIYAFRSNCSYRRIFERWFEEDCAAPGRVFELESYHGMLACVSAGAGLALLPASMLENMPSRASVMAHTLPVSVRNVSIHLVWRRDLRAPAALRRLVDMLEAQALAAAQ
ncbi:MULTISPECIES: putrescine utilization regulator PtrR [unclassified Paraburkholderia]|uniref:putrescine utilization regulator PtrR n=1 Tax=unclassified Paraburkholderia TaxID=2615204 RepID=UPI002AAF9551|nr:MULTISPECIES: LysR substrate-binding domain-containing protein [unclassified Paraburkholderia]